MVIKLRTANSDDIKLLQQLNNELFIDNYKYDNDLVMDWAMGVRGKNYFSRIVKNKRAFCCIAEINGKAVGYISCIPKEISYRKSRYFEIDNLGVVPDYQSKGIGTLLINKAKEWAKKKGYQRLFVISYFKNIRAIAFYKRNGLEEIDVSLETEI